MKKNTQFFKAGIDPYAMDTQNKNNIKQIGVTPFWINVILDNSKITSYDIESYHKKLYGEKESLFFKLKGFWYYSPTAVVVIIIAIIEIYLLVLPELGLYNRYEWVNYFLLKNR